MKSVIVEETKKIIGKQTLVRDENGKYFLISSVDDVGLVSKTFILKCDHNGKVRDFNEIFTSIPANHYSVLKDFLNGDLDSKLNFM